MIYLDNAALKKPKSIIIDYVTDILNNQWYNPNSLYENGIATIECVNSTNNLRAFINIKFKDRKSVV